MKRKSSLPGAMGRQAWGAALAKGMVQAMLEEERADREAFQKELDQMDGESLRRFVPDVYQKDIYGINYGRLWDGGIRLISFDIDDTLADCAVNKLQLWAPGGKVSMPERARELVGRLRRQGFTVALVTNSKLELAEAVREDLKADCCVGRAKKPDTGAFALLARRYGLEPEQMAHVGNSMRKDIAGGNAFGLTTCLVRRAGISLKLAKAVGKSLGLPTKGHLIRERLLERDLWRKHHVNASGDQYYQLGEEPAWRRAAAGSPEALREEGEAPDLAEQAARDLIQKIQAEGDRSFTLEEILENAGTETRNRGIQALRRHLGEEIVFTGLWFGGDGSRDLEPEELGAAEMLGCLIPVGGYTVRASVCLYRDDDEVHYTSMEPVDPDLAARYRQGEPGLDLAGGGVRAAWNISARRGDGEDWRFICIAAMSHRWTESIDFMAALRPGARAPEDQEALYVLNQYTGDSFGVANWYRLSAGGAVTEHSEHPYDPDSFETPWRDWEDPGPKGGSKADRRGGGGA